LFTDHFFLCVDLSWICSGEAHHNYDNHDEQANDDRERIAVHFYKLLGFETLLAAGLSITIDAGIIFDRTRL
jgi:hypothetical protein